jgi:ADP-heptose:LPS heptosyltransferase
VICGDTLAMHLGLALGKRVVALFTCTSPWEIYGYGRLAKVVSPLLERFFYQRQYSVEPGDTISVAAVMESFRSLAVSAFGFTYTDSNTEDNRIYGE